MNKRIAQFALTVLGMATARGALAASYAGDFSITNGNPNGQWTYGMRSTLASTSLTVYTDGHTTGQIELWTGNVGGDATPGCFHNYTGSDYSGGTVVIPAGAADLHPSPDGQYSVARYTAPVAGTYTINGYFTGYDLVGTTTDDHIVINGTSVFDTYVAGHLDQHNFSLTENLNPGDTIDFAVGTGGNGYSYDSTGLSAAISVPEPGAISLVGVGLLALRRRRK